MSIEAVTVSIVLAWLVAWLAGESAGRILMLTWIIGFLKLMLKAELLFMSPSHLKGLSVSRAVRVFILVVSVALPIYYAPVLGEYLPASANAIRAACIIGAVIGIARKLTRAQRVIDSGEIGERLQHVYGSYLAPGLAFDDPAIIGRLQQELEYRDRTNRDNI